MTSRSPETSPQTYARAGGMLYLFIIVVALFGEVFVRGSLIVPRDPTARPVANREGGGHPEVGRKGTRVIRWQTLSMRTAAPL